MIKIPSSKENLSQLFYYLINLYDKEKYPDFKAVYQFELSEKEEIYHFYIEVANGKASYGEGKHKSPSITIHSPLSVWLDISSGKLSGTWGLLTKKYRIEGPVSHLRMFNKVFNKEFTEKEIPELRDKIKDFELPNKRVWKKPDKVLVINASPRRKNGFTYLYLQHFIKGIEQTGTNVEMVDIYDKGFNFEPCRGCFACWSRTNGNCVINDDATELVEKIKDSYLTIYAFPLYVETIPAKLKALFDREFVALAPVFVPFHNLTRHPLWDTKERYMALFSVNGFPEINHFKPVVKTFQGISRDSHRPLLAAILRPGGQFLAAPLYRNYLNEISDSLQQAGKELVEHGKVSKGILKSISSDCGIPIKKWRNLSNMYWFLETQKNKAKNE